MSLYLIGDVQGCDGALQSLLQKIDFSPSRDTVYLLGDLVNRGPQSLGVLRRLMALNGSARCLLGNHDLHLLARAHNARSPGRRDTLDEVLAAPDRTALLDWLRQQPMALLEPIYGVSVLMVHAGVQPHWSAARTLQLAREVENVLQGPELPDFLSEMYGDQPPLWDDALQGNARLRFIVNTLTRMRFCTPQGAMDFSETGGADAAPPGFLPWFDVPGRVSADTLVAFGHWSQLGWLSRSDVLALDTGCVWGGCLSAVRLSPGEGKADSTAGGTGTLSRELIQVNCTESSAAIEKN